jgi:response regulator RpfG family c-di-GMP phosphodiesterase
VSEPGALKLLILDDEARILSALRRSLRREPYEVFTAETVAEALRVLESEPIDLVLSDHKMPGTTGLLFLEQAARLRPAAVRMLITGWTETIPEASVSALGIRAVITKPWEDAALKETLRLAAKGVLDAPGADRGAS